MGSPNPKQRYANAITALAALQPINVNRLPEVKFTPNRLELTANKFGEILTQTVTVTNPITDTLLVGNWDVATSSSDPRRNGGDRPWITFQPAKITGNKVVCQIAVDTRRLMADKTYERQILLTANSYQKTHALTIKVQTAAIKTQKMLYVSLASLFAIALIGGWLGAVVVGITPELMNWVILILGLAIGSVGGGGAAFSKIDLLQKTIGLIVFLSIGVGLLGMGSDLDIILGFLVGLVVAAVTGTVVKHHIENKFSMQSATMVSILTAGLGISAGIDLTLKTQNLFMVLVVLGTGLPLAKIILSPYWEYQKLLRNYRKSERSLIKN
jgi:mRNA-degrading endonuclease toxin of MazEF toxin-antitoxin module